MLRSAVSRTALKATGQSGLGGSSSHAEGMHPNLGLHNAAASGNIGLVKFALENGQPANSNLNGILPLHAACSGGSEQSVRMLIFHGADVNALRLKGKGSSGGPGAEGSTPLHFAAANGHLDIVRILLEAGARPAAADKEALLPEALALGNGHTECANLIRSWISAYGSNGLAGMVESRDTVSGDVTLGPAAYIRYAASGRSASPLSPITASRNNQSSSSSSGSNNVSSSHLATPSSALNNKSSSETLSASNASKLAGSRAGSTSKGGSIFKTSSNPNLRNDAASFATPPLPLASPASLTPSQSMSSSSAYPTAISPALGAFPSAGPSYDSSDYAATSTASALSAAVPGNTASASATGSARESKRRPSLPSILEKAAHPAASLRAALASGSSSNQMGGSMSQASSNRYLDHSFDGASTTSPGKKYGKLAGKRSLSNILRKATGNTPSSNQSSTFNSSMHGSSSSFFADASAASSTSMLNGGTINLDALAKPGRTSGKSFDYQRPAASSQRGLRRNPATASESSSEDPDAWKSTTAPSHQTFFVPPPLPISRSDALAIDQQRRLRSASSSSSLSAAREQFLADGHVQRARAGSNEQVRGASWAPHRGNVSLDLLRPTYFGQNEDPIMGRKSVERFRAGTNQNSRIDAMKRAGADLSQATGSETSSQRTRESAAISHITGRDRSVSGSSSRSTNTTDNDTSHAESTMSEAADEDDPQEFLHHTGSDAGDRTLDGGERHDSHRLPAGLRNMTAIRKQSNRDAGDSSATETGVAAAKDESTRLSGALTSRMTRGRSGSHVSAVSSGSQSGNSARGVGSASIESGSRNSPRFNAGYQALSIAEEHGLATTRPGYMPGTGSSSSVSTRAGRAPSVADSLASHASSSSLRSNYLSAAEQAQAILNHETPYASDGPDGTSTSLAAQLAAYGEALAQERKRAGDARTGPSPSLSTRGSNAALRSKLPSVSEDQSPSRSAAAGAGHSSRSFSVSENRAPNYPATAAQSYNRRVSRRPHSSEGRPSQDGAAKKGVLGSNNMTIDHSTLSASDRAKLGLDPGPGVGDSAGAKGQGQGQGQGSAWAQSLFAPENERNASPGLAGASGLGSPMYIHTAQGWGGAGDPEVQSHGLSHASSSRATDAGSEVGPMVPPKDHPPQRRHNPVTFNSAADMPISLSGRGVDQETGEIDDEDEDDPKTPVLGGNKAVLDKFATSPRSLHRHSPSMPTELSSYTAARRERSPGRPVADSGASSTTSLTPPVPPPRKESIHVPPPTGGLGTLGPDDPSASRLSGGSRMLTPDLVMWSSWRKAAGEGGDEVSGDRTTGSTSSRRWDGLRRPSLNMLRSATSSSTHSQTPSQHSQGGSGTDENQGHSRWSTDETMTGQNDQFKHSSQHSQQQSGGSGGGGGKRRLVRNLLNKAKGTS
ncbi:uncharacterized protein UDID_07745 [Ustilago sp. UG-2017a]|nr:uncharacterized protein UDID_07745 [Ustilago sp. UG-2017a]